jgi:hypothetical protein
MDCGDADRSHERAISSEARPLAREGTPVDVVT